VKQHWGGWSVLDWGKRNERGEVDPKWNMLDLGRRLSKISRNDSPEVVSYSVVQKIDKNVPKKGCGYIDRS